MGCCNAKPAAKHRQPSRTKTNAHPPNPNPKITTVHHKNLFETEVKYKCLNDEAGGICG